MTHRVYRTWHTFSRTGCAEKQLVARHYGAGPYLSHRKTRRPLSRKRSQSQCHTSTALGQISSGQPNGRQYPQPRRGRLRTDRGGLPIELSKNFLAAEQPCPFHSAANQLRAWCVRCQSFTFYARYTRKISGSGSGTRGDEIASIMSGKISDRDIALSAWPVAASLGATNL